MTIIAEANLERLWAMAHTLDTWVLYDHPVDRPGYFVARRWECKIGEGEPQATNDVLMSTDVEELRKLLHHAGRICFLRSPPDDPAVIETWM